MLMFCKQTNKTNHANELRFWNKRKTTQKRKKESSRITKHQFMYFDRDYVITLFFIY